uniref:UBC n=1 Tax=Rhododendron molle TaxID=49168 RepID=A0A1J0A0P9_RHOML|nr:UBC [Rhododendron molle]
MSTSFHKLLEQKNDDGNSKPNSGQREQPIISRFLNPRTQQLVLAYGWSHRNLSRYCGTLRSRIHIQRTFIWFFNNPVTHSWICGSFPSILRALVSFISRMFFTRLRGIKLRNWGCLT